MAKKEKVTEEIENIEENAEKIVNVEKVEVKLKSNIKYGENTHKIGETIFIDPNDLEEFKAAKVIEGE